MRAAIVTGASSGIGLGIAGLLGREGYALTLAGRRSGPLEDAVSRLREAGVDAAGVAGDLTDEAAIVALVDAHRARCGRLDVLVNSAGTGVAQGVGELTARHVDRQLDLDLRAIVLLCREAVPLLRAAGAEHGRALVVNVASLAAVAPHPALPVYSAAKAGVVAFTRAMNRELAGAGVRGCALCPGTVDTPLTAYQDVDRDALLAVDDVVEVVRMLLALSPRAVVSEVVLEGVRELAAG